MQKQENKELKKIFSELRNGNQIIIKELYEKYKDCVCRIAYSILKNKGDSDVVSQIVFLKLYTLSNDTLPKNKEISWLYSFVKNETLIFFRKNKNVFDLENIYDIKDTDEVTTIIDKNEYNNLMKNINFKVREIISLKLFSKFSFCQIGQMLDMNSIFVKISYYKAIWFGTQLN